MAIQQSYGLGVELLVCELMPFAGCSLMPFYRSLDGSRVNSLWLGWLESSTFFSDIA
jgi:hypothetical protein